jgi:hypothetical protein
VIYTPFFSTGSSRRFRLYARIGWTSAVCRPASERSTSDPWSEGPQLNQLKIYEGGKPDNKPCRSSPTIFASRRPPWAICAPDCGMPLAERRLEELYKR